MKSKFLALLAILVVVVFFGQFLIGLQQDKIWKWKVRRQANENEIRAWALAAMKLAPQVEMVMDNRTFLTNAPAYLTNNYKWLPILVFDPNCIRLTYGGGMYHWGLTIGETNLPASAARGQHVEQWWPGIYYWDY